MNISMEAVKPESSVKVISLTRPVVITQDTTFEIDEDGRVEVTNSDGDTAVLEVNLDGTRPEAEVEVTVTLRTTRSQLKASWDRACLVRDLAAEFSRAISESDQVYTVFENLPS